jgi:hypothetical protein
MFMHMKCMAPERRLPHPIHISMDILWNIFSGQLTSQFEDLLAATNSRPDGS